MKKIDSKTKLKMLGIRGAWKCEGNPENVIFDSYKELKENCTGPYRYLKSDIVPITDPENYEFFNPETNRGYIVSGQLWRRKVHMEYYQTKEECEMIEKVPCHQWKPPKEYIEELKRKKAKELENVNKWYPFLSYYDTLEECEKSEKTECICGDPNQYKKAFEIYNEKSNKKAMVAKKKRRDEKGRFV